MPWISKKKLQQMNNSINHMAAVITDYETLIIAFDEIKDEKKMTAANRLSWISLVVRDIKYSVGYSIKSPDTNGARVKAAYDKASEQDFYNHTFATSGIDLYGKDK